jgi:isocitrate dehydrogenase
MLLRHVGDPLAADRVERALLATLGAGVRTADLGGGAGCVGTAAFADAVIARLDDPLPDGSALDDLALDDAGLRGARLTRQPRRAARLQPPPEPRPRAGARAFPVERTVGVDLFLESDWPPAALGEALGGMAAGTAFELRMISNRGTQVFPDAGGRPSLADHYRCRFLVRGGGAIGACLGDGDLLLLLERVGLAFRWVHVERLREFDGVPGFTQAQGEH